VLALGIALGASKFFGVSMELGAFLAGMVVARSDFSSRAATDALPMKDAFAVLFFVSVGMLFDFKSLLESPWLAVATMSIVIVGKPLAAIVITVVLGYPLKTALSVGAVLSQIGEFSFIVATLGMKYELVSEQAFNAVVATAIVSITLTPLLYRGVGPLERWVAKRPRLWKMLNRTATAGGSELEEIDGTMRRAVVVGYGPVGETVTRLLKDNGFSPVIIEMNVDTVKRVNAAGGKAQYGDASHPETLKAAGTEKADILILSASGVGMGREVIREAKRMNPGIRVVARTSYLKEADDLLQAGAGAVFSGEGEVALSMTEGILGTFGATAEQIERESERIRRDLFSKRAGEPA
jgi:CPA2 family monovalent cation:H+ antiporter-2